ncbi:MAG: lysylphosphatidylglycerol synthase transmembrane domain-containing protein [candidate division WOR-3 bacterium]
MTTKDLTHPPFSVLFGGVMIGYLANNFLPLRAGEFVRAYYLGARTGASIASSLSTVFIERFYDILALEFLLITALGAGIRDESLGRAGMILLILAIICVVLVVLFVVSFHRMPSERKRGFPGFVAGKIREFASPLTQLRNFQVAVVLWILSLAAWGSNYLSFSALLWGTPLPTWRAALLLFLFVNLGMLIPSSPGALGVMQVAFWLALAPFKIGKDQSLALSFAYQGGIYLFTAVAGLPFLLAWRKKGKRNG